MTRSASIQSTRQNSFNQRDLLLAFFGCEEAQWSDPHWTASAEERADLAARVPVDDRIYWCEEISEKVLKHNTMLYLAPFSRTDMWDEVDITWSPFDVSGGWPLMMSRKIVSFLRHQAPVRNNRFKHTAPMDRGG